MILSTKLGGKLGDNDIDVLVITQLRVPYTRYGTVVTYKARVPQARVLYVTTVPYMVYGHEQLCNN